MNQIRSTRRNFLKTSALASAATLAAVKRSAHAAGSDAIRIGIIGCGGRGSGAAVDAMESDPGVRVNALCDLFPDRIEGKYNSLRTRSPDQVTATTERFFTGLDGYRGLIENVDVVLIACAAKFHPMYMKAAIAAGKHVFVEKPHAIDPPGIRQVIEACALAEEKKLSVVSGLHRRFHAGMQETFARILDGAIGDVVAIEQNFIRGPYGVDRRHDGQNELHFQYANQYRFSWLCGDDVTQSLVHMVDLATWALGGQAPIRCHGLAGRSSCFDIPFVYGDVFDHHAVVYHYPNGVRMYANCRTQPNCYNECSSIIMGSKGVAYTENCRIDGQNKWRYSGPPVNPYREEHVQLFRSIRAGEPLNCGSYMALSTMVAVMGQLACYSGQQITFDQAMKSSHYFGPKPEDCTWTMTPPVLPDEKGIYPVAIPGKTKIV
jgi:myo-inositol 2-dehydrogenase / D-chiro-inositol 1-dehydrogenase